MLVWGQDMRLHIPDGKNPDWHHGALQGAPGEKAGREKGMCILHWLMGMMIICAVTGILESGKRRKERRMDRAAANVIRGRAYRFN